MKGLKGFQKGYTPWNKGLTKDTDSRIRKLSLNLVGMKKSTEKHREALVKVHEGNRGRKRTIESRQRISTGALSYYQNHQHGRTGKKFSPLTEEHRRRISEANRGRLPWNTGLTKNDDERLSRLSEIMMQRTGINAPHWRGGLSFEPYPYEFNGMLKETIRRRDGYTCQHCGKIQEELGYRLHVHHIDENKNNLAFSNLISLCRSCHHRRHGVG